MAKIQRSKTNTTYFTDIPKIDDKKYKYKSYRPCRNCSELYIPDRENKWYCKDCIE